MGGRATLGDFLGAARMHLGAAADSGIAAVLDRDVAEVSGSAAAGRRSG
jgi:hypothetical protein